MLLNALKKLKGLFGPKAIQQASHDPKEIEELRLAFQIKYHHFKLLLNANNKALEFMTQIEEYLRGHKFFGMTFVRSTVTQIATNVFQMINNLNQIAPHKYVQLYDKFKEIQSALNDLLTSHSLPSEGPVVMPLKEVTKEHVDIVGSKMAHLGALSNIEGINVPNGFVITSYAYRRFFESNELHEEIPRRLQRANISDLNSLFELSSELQQLIIRSNVPPDIAEEVQREVRTLLNENMKQPVRFAVRSSAIGEDTGEASFAGQYRSELNVAPEDILDAYKSVVASKYSLTAMVYRYHHGIKDEEVDMCVGVIQMLDAKASGVMYTSDPLNGNKDLLLINATFGLPKAIVDGSVNPDVFKVSKSRPPKVIKRLFNQKTIMYTCLEDEGVCRTELLGEQGLIPSLSDEEVVELAELGLKIEECFGTPQDIEWLRDKKGRLWILQSRPLKLVRQKSQRDLKVLEGKKVLLMEGVEASPGMASGPVFIVKQDADSLRFKEGSVLVIQQALPRWAPLLSRAKAVIAELGSVTGHLANVAREFGVPAIFGMTGATNLLKDGMEVTVYADLCAVVEGLEEGIGEGQESPNFMKGSSVYQTLEEASRLIVPLTLLDPDSPGFHPKNVKTLHDITRFCHEKAVQELFAFGQSHKFPERSSKQLLCQSPMQFWVINLDDGFSVESPGPYIHIEDIQSIPMKALWEGMVKVPWKGPPPLSTKGFMSILLEATQNPNLETGMNSSFAVKNYFMISRNYCSLQSRFGFHFSIVETLISERQQENYISFQFKGGAANLTRRVLRAQMVSLVLQGLGFRTQIREDALFARMEGFEMDYMLERLRAVGYLIIHTRQLDMVMNSPSDVRIYQDKLKRELRENFGIGMNNGTGGH